MQGLQYCVHYDNSPRCKPAALSVFERGEGQEVYIISYKNLKMTHDLFLF